MNLGFRLFEERCSRRIAMPLKLKKTVAQMLAEANAEIETIPGRRRDQIEG